MIAATDTPLPGADARSAPRLNASSWRVFGLIAAAAAGGWLLFSALVVSNTGGREVVKVVDDLGLAGFQLAAAVGCFVASSRLRATMKRPWLLMGAAVSSVCVGQLIWAFYEIVLDITPSIPSPSDLGNVVALPLSILAGLSFPSAPGRTMTRSRSIVDGSLIAMSAIFVVWVLGLSRIYEASSESLLGKAISVFYLVAQIALLTVLVMATRRARRSLRTRLSLVSLGMLVNVFSISVFAYLQGTHQFGPDDRAIDSAFAIVYVLFLVAALWPAEDVELVDEGPTNIWTAAIPAMCLVAAGLSAFAARFFNLPVDSSPILEGLATVLTVLLVISQLLTQRDSLVLIEASKRAESDLQDRTTLLNEVLTHTPSGLASVGLDMRILDANPSLCSLLGTSSDGVLATPLVRYLPHEAVADAVRHLESRAEGTDTVTSEAQLSRADGLGLWVRWSLTAVRDELDGIDYFLVTLDDVDAKHKAEEAAIANLSGLERLNRLKSEFVSLVSHEFRTALTGIQGFSEMLRDEDLDPADVKQFASDIFNDSVRLNRMITDMLDLDRMEAGRLTFHMGAVDLNHVAQDAVERAKATTTRHSLRAELDPSVPRVAGDADRLLQVLTNLLSNAIKYSPEGGEIVVATRLVSAAIEVSVRDHGVGIPPEFIDKLFERYERYERNLSSSVVGTGLGLVIARRIVEGHGGRIWVESKVGVGTVFHFTIPLQIPRTAPAQHEAPSKGIEPGGRAA